MDGWVVALIVAAGIVAVLAVMQRFGLIDLSDKRRGTGGSGRAGAGAMVGLGDVFFPTRAEAAQEIVQQRERTHEAPAPGDGDLGLTALDLDGGAVTITVVDDDQAKP